MKPQIGIVTKGPYKGFLITAVKSGWVTGFYPSNVKSTCTIEQATTNLRWHWLQLGE